MTSDLVSLDSRAAAYMRGELAASPALGGYLCSLPIETGELAALLPAPRRNTPYDFRSSIVEYPADSVTGGLQKVVSVEAPVCTLASAYLKKFPATVLVTESFLLRKEDVALVEGLPPSVIFHDESVLFWANANHPTRVVKNVVEWIFQSPFGLGILTTPAAAERDAPIVDDRLAHRTEVIILGAYDGEGALLWTPRGGLEVLRQIATSEGL